MSPCWYSCELTIPGRSLGPFLRGQIPLFNPCRNLLLCWASGASILATAAAATPVPQCADLFCGSRAAQIQAGPPTKPSTSPPCPSPGCQLRQLELQPHSGRRRRAPLLLALASGHRGKTRVSRSRRAAQAEKTKSKTNTQQMKPAHPQGSATPSRGPGRRPPARLLGSQTQSPRVHGAGGGTS